MMMMTAVSIQLVTGGDSLLLLGLVSFCIEQLSLFGPPEQNTTDRGFSNRHVLSHTSGASRSRSRCSAEASVLGIETAVSSSRSCPPACVCVAHPRHLIDLFKDPASKYNHILSSWGLGPQHMNEGRGGRHSSAPTIELHLVAVGSASSQ